jgi:hypothetical protein
MLIIVCLKLLVVMSAIVNITQWEMIVKCVGLYIIINPGISPPKLMLINVKSASVMDTPTRVSTMMNLAMADVKTVKTIQLDQNAINVQRTFTEIQMVIASPVIVTSMAPKHHNVTTMVNAHADLVLKVKNVIDVKTTSLASHELVVNLATVIWLVVRVTSPSSIQSLVNATVKSMSTGRDVILVRLALWG